MKTVLIIALSTDSPPYDKMVETSLATWDSVNIEGVETMFAFGSSKKPNTDKRFYFDVGNSLWDMGKKDLAAFELALQRPFDYVARVNASCYVDKKCLLEYCQNLPEENLFAGAEAESVHGFKYMWGGCQFLISRDVIQKIVDNKEKWNHKYIEDESMSLLVRELGIPWTEGYSGAIDKMGNDWRIISYGGESISFSDFKDLIRLKHHFYRVKCDGHREVDEYLMKELFRVLN